MKCVIISIIIVSCLSRCQCTDQGLNFRIEPGSKTCFFETAKAGQTLEAQYQVVDGQHGDLDISFEIIDPNGDKIVADNKKPYNSFILELQVEGGYAFCMDNSFSVLNSKLVFVYVMIEDEAGEEVAAEGGGEVLEWAGTGQDGEPYFVEVTHIADSLTRTLQAVVRARRQLELYAARHARDSYLAFEETFVVDAWSTFQICFMLTVGVVQVYMIKSLFNRSNVVDPKRFC